MDKKQLHVLLIEDNPVDVILLQEVLVQDTLNSFKITTAERLQAALETLKKITFDIILLDLGLPDSQGLRTFTQIHIAAPTIPKIVLSGLTDEVVALQTIHIGAQEYIVKGTVGFGMAARAMRYAIERQQAREALRASEERFRAMIEHGLDDISLLDRDGNLLWESPSVVRNLGYAEATFAGKNIFEIVHPEDQAWTSAYYANLIQSPGSQQRGVFRLLHFDGSWRWVEAIATNMLDNPNIQAIVLNYRDITERKQAEEKQKNQLDELARWNAATLGREQRVLELKHELNELLAQAGQPPRYPSVEAEK